MKIRPQAKIDILIAILEEKRLISMEKILNTEK